MTSTRLDHDSRARRIAAIRFPLAIPVLCAVSARAGPHSGHRGPRDISPPHSFAKMGIEWECVGRVDSWTLAVCRVVPRLVHSR
jgi:hypothetical protein